MINFSETSNIRCDNCQNVESSTKLKDLTIGFQNITLCKPCISKLFSVVEIENQAIQDTPIEEAIND